MTNNILGSLGLSDVVADPNQIPDGKYKGTVSGSRIVTSKAGDKLMHVTTFTVSEGTNKGAQPADFQILGKEVVKDEAGYIVSFTSTMTDQNKQYYKKRLVTDLGAPESEVDAGTFDVSTLTGKKVVFGIKNKDGYVNISFVELDKTAGDVAPATAGSSEGLL